MHALSKKIHAGNVFVISCWSFLNHNCKSIRLLLNLQSDLLQKLWFPAGVHWNASLSINDKTSYTGLLSCVETYCKQDLRTQHIQGSLNCENEKEPWSLETPATCACFLVYAATSTFKLHPYGPSNFKGLWEEALKHQRPNSEKD